MSKFVLPQGTALPFILRLIEDKLNDLQAQIDALKKAAGGKA